MVAAPFSYIGLVIALLLVGGILGSVWVLVNRMVRLPQKKITSQRALPASEEKTSQEKEVEKARVNASLRDKQP